MFRYPTSSWPRQCWDFHFGGATPSLLSMGSKAPLLRYCCQASLHPMCDLHDIIGKQDAWGSDEKQMHIATMTPKMDTLWVMLSPAFKWPTQRSLILCARPAAAVCRQASRYATVSACNLSPGSGGVYCALGIFGSLCNAGHACAGSHQAALNMSAAVLVCSTAMLQGTAPCATDLAVLLGVRSIGLCVVPEVLPLDVTI